MLTDTFEDVLREGIVLYDPRVEWKMKWVRGGVRVQAVQDLLITLGSGNAANTVDCSTWAGLTEWVLEWLSCDIGPYSENSDGPGSVESLLGAYVVESTGDEFSWFGGDSTLPDDGYSPTKSWLIFKFITEEG